MALPGAVAAPTPVGQAGAPPVAPASRLVGLRRPGSRSGPPFRPGQAAHGGDCHRQVPGPRRFAGALTVEKSGADLRLSRLTLVGDKISSPIRLVKSRWAATSRLKLKPLGAPDGVLRYELDSSACPLQFDFLNGALRATSPSGSCSFAQADCRVDGAGLWGPPGSTFGEAEAKTIERERATAEKNVRAHFRSLLARLKKDKPSIQAVVKEQAGFSSQRAQTCRDYGGDDAQGFCALRLTEARDFQLQTRLAAANDIKPDKKSGKKVRRRPRRLAAVAPVVPGPPARFSSARSLSAFGELPFAERALAFCYCAYSDPKTAYTFRNLR